MRTSGGKNRQSDCCKWQQSLKIRVILLVKESSKRLEDLDHEDLGTRIKGLEDCSLTPPDFFLKSFEWKLSDD